MDSDQIEDILEIVRNGNKQEYSKIVVNFQKQLFYYVFCIVNNTQDAEDILQETFVIAFNKLNQYRRHTSFSAWLYRIAKNLSLDTLKKRKKIIPYERDEMENMIENCSLTVTTNEGYDEKVSEVLKRLTFDEKNILLLRIHQEKTYEEIALIINKGQSTTRKQYERAKKKFIKLYDQIDKEEWTYGDGKQIKSAL
ncbi:MAG: polymerase [Clostridiales bacterium]|nr:polymerase [Clostridiales bacterium]